jgi:hypothetical protein
MRNNDHDAVEQCYVPPGFSVCILAAIHATVVLLVLVVADTPA